MRKLSLLRELGFIKLKPIIGPEMSMNGDDVKYSFPDVFKILTQRAFRENKRSKFD